MTATQHAASCHSCLRIPPPSLLLLLLLLMVSKPLTVSHTPHAPLTIPFTGVYFVTLMASPKGRLEMHLQVNSKDTGIVCYGQDGVYGGLTVAVPMAKADNVSFRVVGKIGNSTYMGVVWVTNNFRHFTTVRSNGKSPSSYVQYITKMAPNRKWTKLNPTYSFHIPASGIYWVCARPDCGQSSNTVRVNYLFQAFCSDNQALSAAGAFYFTAGDIVSTKRTLGNSLGSATMLSFVRLLGNTRQYLKSVSNYMAFTAKVDRTGKMGVSEKLSFGGSPLTNYGHMYNKATRLWTIRNTGAYIISVRGAPLNRDNLAIELYNGDQLAFTYYSAKGSYSEQACILLVTKDDGLYLKAVHDRTVNSDTMMSIAFIWPTPP